MKLITKRYCRFSTVFIICMICAGYVSFGQTVNKVVNIRTDQANGFLNSSILIETSGLPNPNDKDVILYVQGIPMENITAKSLSSENFLFELKPEDLAIFFSFKQEKRLRVTVGLKGEKPIGSGLPFNFTFYRDSVWLSFLIIFVILIGSYKYLKGKESEHLNDRNGKLSLAILTMIFWTAIITCSVIYYSVSTFSAPPINQTVLVLLGITGATTAGSKMLGRQLVDRTELKRNSVFTSGFNNKVQIHRYQNVIFNFIYGVVFICEVVVQFKFPEFDPNTLILLGISNGTYLGLKTVE